MDRQEIQEMLVEIQSVELDLAKVRLHLSVGDFGMASLCLRSALGDLELAKISIASAAGET